MALFAIGDLHLPGGQDKPMNVFGMQWTDHFARISEDWHARVREEDAVLIPGDISWTMRLDAAWEDLQAIGSLPGRKVMIRGNHDYWWSGITQVRQALPHGLSALQNDAMDMGDFVLCGSRGWTFPTADTPLSPEDEKVYHRELLRTEMSLAAGNKLRRERPLVLMLHYPPLLSQTLDTGFTALAEKWHVTLTVFGHLHGTGIRTAFQGIHHGVRYSLVSCDSLGFRLAELTL